MVTRREPQDTPSEDTPSGDAVEHDFTIPADADLESGEDEAQPA